MADKPSLEILLDKLKANRLALKRRRNLRNQKDYIEGSDSDEDFKSRIPVKRTLKKPLTHVSQSSITESLPPPSLHLPVSTMSTKAPDYEIPLPDKTTERGRPKSENELPIVPTNSKLSSVKATHSKYVECPKNTEELHNVITSPVSSIQVACAPKSTNNIRATVTYPLDKNHKDESDTNSHDETSDSEDDECDSYSECDEVESKKNSKDIFKKRVYIEGECPIKGCYEQNASQFMLKKHVWDKHLIRLRSCDDCNGKLFVDYLEHRNDNHDFIKKCNYCNQEFSSRKLVREHVKRAHRERLLLFAQQLPQTEETAQENFESLLDSMNKIVDTSHHKYLIERPNFIINYDKKLSRPIWSWEIIKNGQQFKKLRRKFGDADFYDDIEEVPDSMTINELGYQKGHLAASGNWTSPDLNKETFRMTNVVPQPSSVNAGAMKSVEMFIRTLSKFWRVGVLTVPIYDKNSLIKSKGKAVNVPTSIFKLVTLERGQDRLFHVFQVRNQRRDICELFCNCMCTLEDLVNATKFNFHMENWTSANDFANSREFFKCEIASRWCREVFMSQEEFDAHKNKHKRQRYCSYCSAWLDPKIDYKSHLEEEHGKLVCRAGCEKSFINNHLRRDHEKHSHGDKYGCPFCEEVFENGKDFNVHLNQHNQEIYDKVPPVFEVDARICNLCFKAFSHTSGYYKHKKMHIPNLQTCKRCQEVLPTKADLELHLILDHPNWYGRFRCRICGQRFENANLLQLHSDEHEDERPFKCTFRGCEKAYTQKGSLNQHIKLKHQTDNSGNGTIDKSLKDNADDDSYHHDEQRENNTDAQNAEDNTKPLRRQNIVDGKMPNDAKKRNDGGQRHKSVRKKFACNECEKAYPTMKSLVRHKKTHDANERRPCSFCKYISYSAYDFLRHRRDVHGL